MKYLVDANVLSEITRPAPLPAVVEWLRKHERDLVVTPIVLGEIQYGIGLTVSPRKRKDLERWFAEGMQRMRVIDLDSGTASIWATIPARPFTIPTHRQAVAKRLSYSTGPDTSHWHRRA